VATGSEDRSAYLYDARSGGLIERLRHSESVVDVAFSPLYPQLATCALDGSVRFYADQPEE
jgi:WD40 repeat protein